MMLKIYTCLALVQVALGANRYVIDTKSCQGDVFTKIQYYMDTAISKVGLAADLLRPYVQDRNNKPDDRIMKQMTRLFGNDDVSTAYNIFSHYDAVRLYVRSDLDNYSEAWKGSRDKSDLEIHCNADYIAEDFKNLEPNIHWLDQVQNLPVKDHDALLDLKDEGTSTQAVTSPARAWKEGETWPDNIPELITFRPSYIKGVVKRNEMLNSDLVKKAAYPSLVRSIRIKFQRFTDVTNVDVLETPEFVLVHELMHTAVGALAVDSDGRESYGWLNCLRLKDTNNAESLAYFVLVADLIQNYKYDVDDKGKLKAIT